MKEVLQTVKAVAVVLGAVAALAKTAADLVGEVAQAVEANG